MRVPALCICGNKGADQLHGKYAADQRLCFRYIKIVSTIPLLSTIFCGGAVQFVSDMVGNPEDRFSDFG